MADRDYIWSYLHKTLGLNDMQSSVAMGYFQSESGNQSKRIEGDYALKPDFATISNQSALDSYTAKLFGSYEKSNVGINQSAYMKDGHYYPGLGMAQWTGNRAKALMEYASKTGQSWTSLTTQLGYLNQELNGSYKGVLTALKNSTTVEQAMAAFASFENSNIINKRDTSARFRKMYEERYQNALTLYAELTGSPLVDIPEDLTMLESLFGDFLSENELAGMMDPEDIKCLLVYVPQDVLDIDYVSLAANRVMGVAFYGGDLTGGTYRSPTIDAQVKSALENQFPFAMIVGVYANSEEEAKKECDQLYYTLSRYPPGLGLWLDLHTTSTEVLDYYYKRCQYWGLGNACGLYCDKETLEAIGWENYQEDYLLWLINHFEDDAEFEILDEILTPEFFSLDGGESNLLSGIMSVADLMLGVVTGGVGSRISGLVM